MMLGKTNVCFDLTSVVPRMERVGDDLPEDLGREVPQRREAAARAAASVGLVLWREHGSELVEVVALVVRPASGGNHFLEIRVVCLCGDFGSGAQEDRIHAVDPGRLSIGFFPE